MKREHRRIVASVCYEYQMAQILERAGVDLLSVGDSVGRAFLGHEDPDAMTVDEMIPFCRAVSRAAKRAIVNCDMPGSAVKGGPQTAAEAARRLAGEAGAELVKVDIRDDWDGLMPVVEAVLKTGVAVYPQIGFPALGPRHGGAEVQERALKKVKQLEEAGASLLDLTAFTPEVYAAACASTPIPIVGGQTGPEADGKIYVSYPLVGYQAAALDRDDDRPNAARYIFDVAKTAFDNVRTGNF
jgi:3-methyl-2-oxobutanoate hydroxymethyltransferase